MGRAPRLLGLLLVVGGIGAIGYGVVEALQIGTCVSGGPYQATRECPPGTFSNTGLPIAAGTMALILGIFALVGSGLSTMLSSSSTADPRTTATARSIAPPTVAEPESVAHSAAATHSASRDHPSPTADRAEPQPRPEPERTYDSENLDPLAGN